MWDDITDTLVAEFSDLPDVSQVTRIVLRLVIAAALAGDRLLLAVLRALVRRGAAALATATRASSDLSVGVSSADMTRVIQGVVAGIGFLGAGAIIKGSAEESVKGLTTAAGIWLTAAIGIACGLGRESTAVLSALLAFAILALVPHLTRFRDN